MYEELDDKVRLSAQSSSTLSNYARKLAHLSLHFGKLPQHISEKEINKYLASLARQSKTPSLSDFKFAVYGLSFTDISSNHSNPGSNHGKTGNNSPNSHYFPKMYNF